MIERVVRILEGNRNINSRLPNAMEGTGALIHDESNVMPLLRYGKLYINCFPAEGLAFDDVNGGIVSHRVWSVV
jgi:hypothetical protein